ncbi:hypothetical protein AQI88_37630 [Streptomyces cellostaticus]|uniref:Uncharacterized protein n=1 Tax=Streptomyces cellostaticus TaxID=67285 RepID=A0A117PTZ4_9ACTN|nr:substrate-binding domain-containing protein [Streptomyces cellostaticus]KUM91253.1 hypothetical protein AQI88_37630 [Streptomyces cellostaticus]
MLIGTYAYESLGDLPAVERNVRRLGELMRDPELWGLPEDRCIELLQPSRKDVFDTLHTAASVAADTLVLYFAGHGLIDPYTRELYLALEDSCEDRLDRALRYEDLRRVLAPPYAAGGPRARRKVVILDCCWSGAALDGTMAAADGILGRQADIRGTFVLTATAATRQALAPKGKPYTAFTGELIDAIVRGVPGAPELLSMSTLYDHLAESLPAKMLPPPQQGHRNSASHISLFRNRAFQPPDPPSRQPAPPLLATEDQDGARPRIPVARRRALLMAVLLATSVASGIAVREWATASDVGDCPEGRLTLTGSTAFAPLMRKAAARYASDCPDARFSFELLGGYEVQSSLNRVAQGKDSGSSQTLAFTEGEARQADPRFVRYPIAYSLYTFVVNKDAGVTGLSLDQIRKIYSGEVSNWKQVGGKDLPVRLVSRPADSSTRQILEQSVLGRPEPALTSTDCKSPDRGATHRIVRCELSSTREVLDTVPAIPGALGYSELDEASRTADLLLNLDGHAAGRQTASYYNYPFWRVTYAYANGLPSHGSLASAFLRYLTSDAGSDMLRAADRGLCSPEDRSECRPMP